MRSTFVISQVNFRLLFHIFCFLSTSLDGAKLDTLLFINLNFGFLYFFHASCDGPCIVARFSYQLPNRGCLSFVRLYFPFLMRKHVIPSVTTQTSAQKCVIGEFRTL